MRAIALKLFGNVLKEHTPCLAIAGARPIINPKRQHLQKSVPPGRSGEIELSGGREPMQVFTTAPHDRAAGTKMPSCWRCARSSSVHTASPMQ